MWAVFFLLGENNPFYGNMYGPFANPAEARKWVDQHLFDEEWPYPLSWSPDGTQADCADEGCIMIQELTK